MQQPSPLLLPRQRTSPDIYLQRLVNQPRFSERGIPLIAPAYKLLLGGALLEVLVVRTLVGDGREGLRGVARVGGWVVVASVDFGRGREGEEFMC